MKAALFIRPPNFNITKLRYRRNSKLKRTCGCNILKYYFHLKILEVEVSKNYPTDDRMGIIMQVIQLNIGPHFRFSEIQIQKIRKLLPLRRNQQGAVARNPKHANISRHQTAKFRLGPFQHFI